MDRQEEDRIAQNLIARMVDTYKDEYPDELPQDLESRIFASMMNGLIMSRSIIRDGKVVEKTHENHIKVTVEVGQALLRHIANLLDSQPLLPNSAKMEILRCLLKGAEATEAERENQFPGLDDHLGRGNNFDGLMGRN